MADSGFPTGTFTGSHEELLLGFDPVYDTANPIRVLLPIEPAQGCGNSYYAFGADDKLQSVLWIEEGSYREVSVLLDPTRSIHSVFAEAIGTWSTVGDIGIFEPTILLEASAGKSLSITFNARSEFIDSYGDGGQLTNWDLVGLERFSTSKPNAQRKTLAQCDITIVKVGSTVTITVSLSGTVLAQGSINADSGTVTIDEENVSGVSGVVDLDYLYDVTAGAVVTKRYAAYYDVAVVSAAILNVEANANVLNVESNAQVYTV